MTKSKGMLQKSSLISGYISLLLAIITGVILFLRDTAEGVTDPIYASLLATTFFFVCVGVVLIVMGKADIPDFTFEKPKKP